MSVMPPKASVDFTRDLADLREIRPGPYRETTDITAVPTPPTENGALLDETRTQPESAPNSPLCGEIRLACGVIRRPATARRL